MSSIGLRRSPSQSAAVPTKGDASLCVIVHDSPTAMEALHVSTAPEQDFQKLINDLFTECTRCKCEIRVREMINNSPAPPTLSEVPTFAKGARPLAVSFSLVV